MPELKTLAPTTIGSPRSARHVTPAIGLVLALIVFAGLYYPCLTIFPSGDDWLLLQPAHQLVADHGFFGALSHVFVTPTINFYRPITLIPLMFTASSVWAVQLLKMLLMLVLVWLMYAAARMCDLNRRWSAVLALVTLFHQVFAAVITELDFWGDFLSSLTFLLLFVLSRWYQLRQVSTVRYVLLMAGTTALCLLSKEAGVSCFITPAAFAVLLDRGTVGNQRKGFVAAAAVALLLTVSYLLLRTALGVPTTSGGSSYYTLRAGSNMVLNVGLAFLALFSPINTIQVALGAWPWKVAALLWVAGTGTITAWGLIRCLKRHQWRLPVILWILFFAAQGPVFFMPHLTEGNMARSVALGWIAFAVTVFPLAEQVFWQRLAKWVPLVVTLWLVLDIAAVHSKVHAITGGRIRTMRFQADIRALMPVPPDRPIRFGVVNPGYAGYSYYVKPFCIDLQTGEVPYALRDFYGKPALEASTDIVSSLSSDTLGAVDFIVRDNGSVVPRVPAISR